MQKLSHLCFSPFLTVVVLDDELARRSPTEPRIGRTENPTRSEPQEIDRIPSTRARQLMETNRFGPSGRSGATTRFLFVNGRGMEQVGSFLFAEVTREHYDAAACPSD
jgi:hypothetical protein